MQNEFVHSQIYPRRFPGRQQRNDLSLIFLLIPVTMGLLAIFLVFLSQQIFSGSSFQSPSTNKMACPFGTDGLGNCIVTGQISPYFADGVQYWKEDILTWSQENELDPNLVATVMMLESCGNPDALSPAGAMGLFQVMPFHFADGEDSYLPETNAARGLAYLKQSYLANEGDIGRTLAGYNGGIGVSLQDSSTWPEETIHYASWGATIYAEVSNPNSSGEFTREWASSYGYGLCQSSLSLLASR